MRLGVDITEGHADSGLDLHIVMICNNQGLNSTSAQAPKPSQNGQRIIWQGSYRTRIENESKGKSKDISMCIRGE